MMDFFSLLTLYLQANLLIVVAAGMTWVLLRLGRGPLPVFPAIQILRLQYLLIAAVVLLPLVNLLLPVPGLITPSAQVWSGGDLTGSLEILPLQNITWSSAESAPIRLTGKWMLPFFLLSALASALLLCTGLPGLFRLRRVMASAFTIRQIGGVTICASQEVETPFAFWRPGRAHIVIPIGLITHPDLLRIAVRHELQHHRQRDTVWIYPILAFRCLFCLNPVARLWTSWLSEIQEFACDEALITVKKIDPRTYSRCLLEVAVSARNPMPLNVVGMASRKLLSRRIQNMLYHQNPQARGLAGRLFGLLALSLMVAAALASDSLVQDRRVTMEEAQILAEKASSEAFPVHINQAVLDELNRFLGTPKRRNFVRASLERMGAWQPMMQEHLERYHHPSALLAIPLVESGYQNLDASHNPVGAAGLWQFIPTTARKFNLRVDETTDDRLDATLETDAALRLLGSLNLRFQDWRLAIMAYNMGATGLQRGIDETQSRDPWTLIDEGFQNDNRYLAKVMAAVLIINNPEIVD